jgi:hypothetical protein
MEVSPFDSNKTISMYIEPILNQYYRTYQNIITLSAIPDGPMSNMVISINVPRLSEFQSLSAWSPPPVSRQSFSTSCIYALLRYQALSVTNSIKNGNYYMYANDIPNVYGYLESHGYKIMTELTTMTYRGPVDVGDQPIGGNRKFICMFRYEN